jgi:pyridoxal phosphate enzyme (YggS family)
VSRGATSAGGAWGALSRPPIDGLEFTAMVDDDIRSNLEQVGERIARAAERAGRRGEDVLLIAVSKTVEVERIRQAVAAGVRALGENRVQEAKDKVTALGHPVPWHLIGHLQTNKVRDALTLFDVIQSIDRLELASECDRRARSAGRVVDALLEVNVGGESSKSGFAPGEVAAALDALAGLNHIRLHGLMAIPPAVERAEDTRGWFRQLRGLAERHGLKELSMGMSADFEVAIEEGATMVRVGTAIFGPRPPRATRA